MLVIFSLFVVVAVAYVSLREGLLTASCTLINVLFAGLGACALFEPLADQLEELFKGSFLDGSEDALALAGLFAAIFAGLKVVTAKWSGTVPDYPLAVDRIGSGVLGALAGYLLAGFLVCIFQTLPWSANFMGFRYEAEPVGTPGSSLRRILPPDRVWLAMMHHAGATGFSRTGHPTFDEDGSFSLRYARFRRKAP